jgi:isopenicillin-N epimerase
MEHLKTYFLLDPDVVFLNHGSFGACPRPVMDVYQEWQRRLERQPVAFIARELSGLLQQARQVLGDYVNAAADDLVFVPNATFAINVIARSLPLEPGDEVLATDHEYGACDRIWRFICQKRGAHYVRQPLPLPVQTPEEIVEQVWQGVTPRTRVIFLSHITSATALCLPVAALCARARAAGILTVIDGAHAPGQMPLDLTALDADFYTGNCHKWLLSPKGAAFLYARPACQRLLEPLVVSWGWESERPGASPFLDHHQWWGTKDPAAYLSVPAAIQFQRDHNWPAVRAACHRLGQETLRRLSQLTGLPSLYPPTATFFRQMFTAPLPASDLETLQARLYQEYRVEVPILRWQERTLLRVSLQGYNTHRDADTLISALAALL